MPPEKVPHMRQVFTMTIPMDLTISNNRQSPIWLRKRVKDGIGDLTRAAAQNLYPCGKATIYVGITKRTKGLYDPVNLSDTAKAAVDTLVRMGVVDEDDYHHVAGPWLYHAGVDNRIPPRHLRATFTLTDQSTIPF